MGKGGGKMGWNIFLQEIQKAGFGENKKRRELKKKWHYPEDRTRRSKKRRKRAKKLRKKNSNILCPPKQGGITQTDPRCLGKKRKGEKHSSIGALGVYGARRNIPRSFPTSGVPKWPLALGV